MNFLTRTLETSIGTATVQVPQGMYIAMSRTACHQGQHVDLHHRSGVPVKLMGLGAVYPKGWATSNTVDPAAGYRIHSYHYDLSPEARALTYPTLGEAVQALLACHGYQA